jgi:predicted Rossmann fold nucleotide-binding protein DprA/Smf involved in DNA uptake
MLEPQPIVEAKAEARAPATMPPVAAPSFTTAAPAEAAVLAGIGDGAIHVDEIARVLDLPISEVSSTLQLLELQGRVRLAGPMTYIRA